MQPNLSVRLLTALALFVGTFALSGGLSGQGSPAADVVVVLKGHQDTVDAVAVSPDGKWIATGSFDKLIKLWDVQTGKEARTYGGPQGHQGMVLSVAFSAKGDQLASGGADNSARIWDVPVNFPTKTFTLSASITKVVVANDGKTFAAAGADGTIKLFPQGEEKGALDLKGHKGAIVGLGFTGNGQLLISAGADHTVRLWNQANGQPVAAFGVGSADITGLAVNANNTAAYTTAADGTLKFWQIPPPPPKLPNVFSAVSAAGAAATEAKAAKPGTILPGTPTRVVALGAGKPLGLVVSPAGERVVAVGPGKEAVSWNTGNGTKERGFEAGGDATAAAITKDGQRIAVGGSDGSVKVYTIADGKLAGSIAAGSPVVDLAFHPTAPVLVGVLKNQTATAWTVAFNPGQPLPSEFGRTIQSFPHPKPAFSAAFNAEGLLLTVAEDKELRRFRIASDSAVKNFAHPNLVDAVAFDETGTQLATGCHDGNLRIWDIAKGQAVKTIAAHIQTTPPNMQNPIYCVAWAPGGKQILTTSYDKSIKLWDAASGNLVKEFKAAPDPKPGDKVEPPKEPVGHRNEVYSAAFSKDGKYIASGGNDRTAKLWEVASGKVVRDFPNPDMKPAFPGEPAPSHPGWVYAVRFTPDDKYLISAGAAPRYQGYLAVWSVADGKRVYGAERDIGPIQGLGLFPDGSRLVLGCGPRNRLDTNSDVLVIKTPGR